MVLPIVIWIMRDQFAAIPSKWKRPPLWTGFHMGRVLPHCRAARRARCSGRFHHLARPVWNEYFFAALLTATDSNTLPVMIASQTAARASTGGPWRPCPRPEFCRSSPWASSGKIHRHRHDRRRCKIIHRQGWRAPARQSAPAHPLNEQLDHCADQGGLCPLASRQAWCAA